MLQKPQNHWIANNLKKKTKVPLLFQKNSLNLKDFQENYINYCFVLLNTVSKSKNNSNLSLL